MVAVLDKQEFDRAFGFAREALGVEGLGGLRVLRHAVLGGQFARALTPVDWADCDALLLDHGAMQNLSVEAVMRIAESAPVAIGLTPQEEREAITRFRACGVHHYALKPLRSRSLVERLRIALGAQAPSVFVRSTTGDSCEKPAWSVPPAAVAGARQPVQEQTS